jgi:hypothetical protein
MSSDQAKRQAWIKTAPPMKRWTNHAITLLLLLALIVAGISVYYTRQEWREMYMRVMKHR